MTATVRLFIKSTIICTTVAGAAVVLLAVSTDPPKPIQADTDWRMFLPTGTEQR